MSVFEKCSPYRGVRVKRVYCKLYFCYSDIWVTWTLESPYFNDVIFQMLTNNRIWKQRTVDVGVVSVEDVLNCGFRFVANVYSCFKH